jgi:sortase A
MRGRKIMIILTLGFLIGISLLLYPAVSNFWNSKTQSRAIVNYESVLQNLTKEDYAAIFAQAHDYNRRLFEQGDALLYYDEVEGYIKIKGKIYQFNSKNELLKIISQ